MPDFPHPPYFSNTQPRQLDRWLDVNAQNGPLGRTQSFITLPAFSKAITWRGYSELVLAFNFEGPNAFSLKNTFVIPTDPNYLLCIMWEDSNRVVHRYSLWRDVGEVIYFDIPAYIGQVIQDNFRFEVWSTNNTPAVQTTALQFYTSVLGNIDYRYGVDFTLVSSDTPVTNFSETLTIPAPPNDVNNGLANRFISTSSFAAPNWTSVNDISFMTSANIRQSVFNSNGNAFTGVNTTGASLVGTLSGTPTVNYLFAVVYFDGSTGTLVQYNNSPLIGVTPTTVLFGADVVAGVPVGQQYLLVGDYINKLGYVINIKTRAQAVIPLTNGAPTASTALTMLSGGTTANIIETLSYFNLANSQGVYDYIFAKYGGFTLPLTFPNNSIPALN